MPQLFHPKTEPGFPANCITVADAVNALNTLFPGTGFRVERLKIECVTEKGNTLKLKWDRRQDKARLHAQLAALVNSCTPIRIPGDARIYGVRVPDKEVVEEARAAIDAAIAQQQSKALDDLAAESERLGLYSAQKPATT
jgi:hypothetical protein